MEREAKAASFTRVRYAHSSNAPKNRLYYVMPDGRNAFSDDLGSLRHVIQQLKKDEK